MSTLYRFAERCDHLGVEHSGVVEFPGGAGVDVADPDGTVVRLHISEGRPPFMGVESDADAFRTYNVPRLDAVTPNTTT